MEQNTAETIARTLGKDILNGTITAGAQLAPVRELASEFQVNTATIQRVIAQLEAKGLVEAKRGSGVRVLNTATHGRLQLWPLKLEAMQREPQVLAKLIDDTLEIRRSLTQLVLAKLPAISAPDVAVLTRMSEEFAQACEAADAEPSRLLHLEHALFRTLLQAVDQQAILAFLNEMELCIEAVPALIDIFYERPERNAQIWRHLSGLIAEAPVDLPVQLQMVDSFLQASDKEIIARIKSMPASEETL